MKTYVITVSRTFPATHRMAGEPTGFETAIFEGTKIHTIRANYEYWKKRIEAVQNGEAIISIRVWSGKPYASPQVELKRFSKEDGVGIQKLMFHSNGLWTRSSIDNGDQIEKVSIKKLSENDGLEFVDFLNWFEKYDISQPLAIIHFTSFRY